MVFLEYNSLAEDSGTIIYLNFTEKNSDMVKNKLFSGGQIDPLEVCKNISHLMIRYKSITILILYCIPYYFRV